MNKHFGRFIRLASLAILLGLCSCDKNQEYENSEDKSTIKSAELATESDSAVVLFSTKDSNEMLRATGYSTGGSFIYNIMADSRSKNTAPDSYYFQNFTYRKIPVDLNERAKGNWIYLYYAKTTNASQSLSSINCTATNSNISESDLINNWSGIGKDVTGKWIDLNEKAGGKWIYLVGKKYGVSNTYAPIKNIMIVSFNSEQYSYTYNGWTRVSCNLNMGVNIGKWIYMYVER